jgi:hypothetical protein
MKKMSAILHGVSTLALATTFISSGAFAEEMNKTQPRFGNDQDSAPAINLRTTTYVDTINPPPATANKNTDAIVTSSASTSSIGDAQSSFDLPSNTAASPLSNFSLRFDSIYYGSSITSPAAGNSPSDTNSDGGFGDRTFVRNVPSVGYYINPNLMVGAVTKIDVYPSHTVGYAFEDSYVHLQVPKLIDQGNFKVMSDLRLYAPTSALSQSNGMVAGSQIRFVPTYNIPHSRFTVGAYLYDQYTFHNSQVDTVDAFAKNAWNNEIYAGPNVAYQLTPTVALTCLYEMDAVNVYGSGAFSYTSDTHSFNGYTDLEPGASWDITPSVNLSPFLNMYPGSNFSLDTTSINLWLSVKLL